MCLLYNITSGDTYTGRGSTPPGSCSSTPCWYGTVEGSGSSTMFTCPAEEMPIWNNGGGDFANGKAGDYAMNAHLLPYCCNPNSANYKVEGVYESNGNMYTYVPRDLVLEPSKILLTMDAGATACYGRDIQAAGNYYRNLMGYYGHHTEIGYSTGMGWQNASFRHFAAFEVAGVVEDGQSNVLFVDGHVANVPLQHRPGDQYGTGFQLY